ncbi:GntR family transcriptional regulator [Agromyces sp. MMS24-K17]|uniref:GntR family transcriptional regulator n=1 Tax=Agromyces sp. MMS24-K17 TaxID=3372850 RepID=UPI0037544FCC
MTVYTQLRDLVVTGALDGHEKVSESAIAERLEVSRTPVREALQRLEADGLVLAQGRGVRIRRRTGRELAWVYEARAALDAFAAAALADRQRAGRLEPAAFAELDRLAGEADAHTRAGDLAAATDSNRRFHERIAALAGNAVIVESLARHWDQILVSTRTGLAGADRTRAVHDEHLGLLAAIRDGDADRAATAAREHALATRDLAAATASTESSSTETPTIEEHA